MRFYGDIQRVSDNDEERMVWGYASTEQRASDGLVITRDALAEALADYMRFANIREMHQLSAVGVAREATIDEGGLYLGAWVQDDDAWDKVKTGVYRGFSIGAKATARDAADSTKITGIRINEISLVDRPADPGAVFDVFRAAELNEQEDAMKDPKTPKPAEVVEQSPAPDGGTVIAPATDVARAEPAADAAEATPEVVTEAAAAEVERTDAAAAVVEATVQAEAEVDGPAADPAPEPADDPVARAVAAAEAAQAGVAAALDHVERGAKPEAAEPAPLPGAEIRRGLCSVAQLGWILSELSYMVRDAAFEDAIEGQNSMVPQALRAALLELAKAYRVMSDSEIAELLQGVSVDVSLENGIIQLAAYGADIERAATHEISAETGVKLQAALDGVIARGWKPNVDRAVEVLTGERDTLLRTVTGLTDQMTAMTDRIGKLEAQPMPPKTAGAAAIARAVDKAEDAAGAVVAPRAPELSDAAVKAAFDQMSDEDKAMILTRAALQRPHVITRR